MSETYVTLKIREALRAADGSRAQAQRILLAWALDDEQLLRGLAKPFLKAIIGSAVAHVARGADAKAAPVAAPAPRSSPRGGPKKLPPQMLDAIIAQMGQPASTPAPRAAAPMVEDDGGGEQAESLKALAAAFKRKF